MAYSSGILNYRAIIAKRSEDVENTFGKSGQPRYEILGEFHVNKTFSKGVKALHEGALDAYNTVMFRMRYHACIDRWCLIQCEGVWYQIQSLNADRQENQIQITAIEMANQDVNII